jgi:hypothetical protein
MISKIFFTFFVLAIGAVLILSFGHAGSAQTVRVAFRVHSPLPDTAVPYEQMSHSEKKQYMKDVVMPKIVPLMQKFDPKGFKEVKCVTCHGMGAKDGTYKMPCPQLPKLPATREGFQALSKKKPAIMKFMSDTMKPVMAELLGMKPFDPKTGSGFSCGNCHTNAKK